MDAKIIDRYELTYYTKRDHSRVVQKQSNWDQMKKYQPTDQLW